MGKAAVWLLFGSHCIQYAPVYKLWENSCSWHMMNLDKMSPYPWVCSVWLCSHSLSYPHWQSKIKQQTISVDRACSKNILQTEEEDTFSQFPTEGRSHWTPTNMNKSLFSMFRGSWIRPSLQQLHCLTKETFCPHLSLICKEDPNYGKTNIVLPCKGLQSNCCITTLLSLTFQRSRIPRENGNAEATDIIKSVTKPLCSSCSFLCLQWRTHHLQPFKALR